MLGRNARIPMSAKALVLLNYQKKIGIKQYGALFIPKVNALRGELLSAAKLLLKMKKLREYYVLIE